MNSRLTTATMYGSLMDSLMQSQRNIQDLQRQIASGNKYNKLSDNPAAITRSLELQSAMNTNDKYSQNTTSAITMLRYANSALNNILDAAQSIRSLIIQAGDGSYDSAQLKDINAQIEANKKIMLDNLNARVAGQYIFGGTDTTTPPFVQQADGNIVYQGSNDRIKYALNESLLGDVSFAGSDIIKENDDSYFICSHYVDMDWRWHGREEKVQITVGNRTLSVFIPEDWQDYSSTKTSTDTTNTTDYNRYRDPGEVSGITLDDLAEIVNRSLEEQGADMLVKVSIDKDQESGTQQLIMKSITGEKIGITGWPDTDYMTMPASLTSNEFTEENGNKWKADATITGGTNALMGNFNILNWNGNQNAELYITVGDTVSRKIDFSNVNSSTDLLQAIKSQTGVDASLSTGDLNGRLILKSDQGEIKVSGAEASALFGASSLTSTRSSITVRVGDDTMKEGTTIYINAEDSLTDLAERLNATEGVYSRASSDGSRITITAQRTGDLPADRLANNDAEDELHYPTLNISADGAARNLFNFSDNETTIKVTSERRNLDHSHIDVFDALGMETAMKSREFAANETLTVTADTQLHWRILSGGHYADIKLNEGSYTLDNIAERLKNACSGWAEVTLENDADDKNATTFDGEGSTKRLVMRGYNGEQVLFLDMNEYNYADQMGLSTALRTDGYTSKTVTTTNADGSTTTQKVSVPGTGTKCVNFPSAPCVDDNVGVPLRVQMNCGMYYDVNIKKADVIDHKTGFVDRTKVMQAIVDEVNEQEGHDIMGLTVHLDKNGQEIDNSSAIYFLSGEAFTVVDMPFNDPEWYDYSGGIAAQMGIHGGVSSNLRYTTVPMKDNMTFAEAYEDEDLDVDDLEFREGTIRFESLGRSVELDVGATDTVKDVMDRLRTQAGDWLYINYYDEHMGQVDIENTGDFPIISISAVDGSAVSVLDVKGHIAQDALGISTGIQTRINPSGDASGGFKESDFVWDLASQEFPAPQMELIVAGYSHTIDLREIREVTSDDRIDMYDIAEFVNARMQDYDVRAEINQDNELMLWSKRGYSIQVKFLDGKPLTDENGNIKTDDDGNPIFPDLTSKFMEEDGEADDKNPKKYRSYYRGGYNLDGNAINRGIGSDLYDYGIHSQNATIRSGANTMRQNGFGVINDVMAAIESGNRDDLGNKLLPKIDDFINNILYVMSENGALQNRYTYNQERIVSDNLIMSESYDDVAKIDPAEAVSQLMVADYMYQANLAIISRLIQPSLLDFLS